MGIYDRDWYREERRQARRAAQQQPPTDRRPARSPAGPPSLTSGKSILIILTVFAVALIVYGFA